ncbi:uncharacterized protein LOC105685667 [Athalia rosae]|uniref:uncharacterized protein LOC105685667 n=1 Tax=Athalia rosae TaxID=37344 RepID=UPI00203337F6|nr:uncharacterized protein LOC105685667 [Athalia rosae]
MAMLAEPRSKQKWILNPRGNQWSEDSCKFGQKMLEKMGWTNGKGLGANEQGMTEHIKVNFKNNQSGIGFKDSGEHWTQQQADFNDFLSQLQKQNSNSYCHLQAKIEDIEPEAESLELKSKQSRARLHYQKFIQGKDVKKYSSKDLANIFGQKELIDANKASTVVELVNEINPEPTGSEDRTAGVLTIKGGNIDDYFQNKLSNLKKKQRTKMRIQKNNCNSEHDPKLRFGFESSKIGDNCDRFSDWIQKTQIKTETSATGSRFAFANEGLDLEYPEKKDLSKNRNAFKNSYLDPARSKKSKKKCRITFSNKKIVNPALSLNDAGNDNDDGVEFEVSHLDFGIDNSALDLSEENGRKRRVTFNDQVEYNTDVIRKKKKKDKGKGKLDKFEVDNSKLRKKVKDTVMPIETISMEEAPGFINEALDIEAINEEICDNEVNEQRTKRSKRQKYCRESNLETIEEISEENRQLEDSEVGEVVLLDKGLSKNANIIQQNSRANTNFESNSYITESVIESTMIGRKEKKAERGEMIAELPSNIKNVKEDEPEKIRKIDGSDSDDVIVELIAPIERKKRAKRHRKSKGKGTNDFSIVFDDAACEPDIARSGTATKRRRSDIDGVRKKKPEMDESVATENSENLNRNKFVTRMPNTKGKKSRKIFKSLFARAPTLYFSGSNINRMAGYGADHTKMPDI